MGPEQRPKHPQAHLAEIFIKIKAIGSASGGF